MTDSAKPTLLVVDGHSLAYRAFFALPVDNFSTKDGQHTNGIYGFLAMLINLIKAEQPTHLAVAFDTSRQSFRTREYTEYKANRSETPSEFKGQIPLLQDCLAAMSIPVLQKEDIEADDILATLATQGAEQGFDVLVCSGDRDTIQLVNDDVTLLYPNVQGVSQLKRYDTDAVIERYGVRPEQYPDIAALVGETSDNLPGVPKVGEKTAVKWLRQFGSLDALLENADKVTGVVGGNLREHLDDVRRNRALNRLLHRRRAAPRPRRSRGAADGRPGRARHLRAPRVQDADPARRRARRHRAADGRRDVRGRRPDARRGRAIAGRPARLARRRRRARSASRSPSRAACRRASASRRPMPRPRRRGRPRSPRPSRPWLASDAPKVFSDAKPQVKALRRAGVRVGGLAFDTIVAGWLLRPSFPDKTLADLVDRYLDEKLPEADPTQLVPETEGATPGQLSWFTLRVTEALRAELPPSVAAVLTDIELPTLLALADMELAGVAVSHDKLAAFSGELGERADALAQQAYAAIGREVNLGSPKQLQEVLFDELAAAEDPQDEDRLLDGCRGPRRSAGDQPAPVPRPAAAAPRGHEAAPDHRVARQSRSRRTAACTRRTCRPAARPAGSRAPTRTCRTSRSARARAAASASAFEVGEGYETLLTADYSQIEMRIMAHLSEDPGLIEAFNSGEDLHRFVGARVFGVAARGRHPGDAHEGQGDVVRPRLRALRVRALEAAAHRADRGEAAHDGVLRPVRRGARLPAVLGRAGEDRRLHRDDLRPPPARSPTSRAPTACCARTPSARRSTRRSRAARPTS